MPIPIGKLEDAQRSIAERILELLGRRPEEAFTLVEIYSELNMVDAGVLALISLFVKDSPHSAPLQRWKAELDKLVSTEKVRCAELGGVDYYGIGLVQLPSGELPQLPGGVTNG